jgi:hypothetical protein
VTYTRAARIYTAIIAGLALSLAALPAPAQTAGGYYGQNCQYSGGRWVCPRGNWGADGYGARPYDRWDNGTPASGFGSGSSSSQHQFPYTTGSYHTWYGFGR